MTPQPSLDGQQPQTTGSGGASLSPHEDSRDRGGSRPRSSATESFISRLHFREVGFRDHGNLCQRLLPSGRTISWDDWDPARLETQAQVLLLPNLEESPCFVKDSPLLKKPSHYKAGRTREVDGTVPWGGHSEALHGTGHSSTRRGERRWLGSYSPGEGASELEGRRGGAGCIGS